MFTVVITEKGGEQRRLEFDKSEVNIGRVQGNDIILPKGNVSKRHSRIVVKDGKFIIVDLKSTNGTYVNGRKITSPLVIKNQDKVYIGDFILHVDEAGAVEDAMAAPGAAPMPPAGADPGRRPPPPPPKRKPRPTMPGDPDGPSSRPQRDMGPADRTTGPTPGGDPMGASGPGPAGPPPGPGASRRPGGAPGRRGAVRDTLGPERLDDPMSMEPSMEPAPLDEGFGAPPPMGGREPPPDPRQREPAPAPHQREPAPAPRQREPAPAPRQREPAPAPRQREPAPAPRQREPAPAPRQREPAPASPQRSERGPSARDPRRGKVFELQKEVHDRLIEYLDLRRMDIDQLADEELWEKTENAICDIVESMDSEGRIQSFVDQDLLIKDVLNEALGLGPLEDLLAEEDVDEIMVNRSDQIYVESGGRLKLTDKGFSSDKAVLGVIERIVAPLGRRIDESSPLVDARLKDGSRVNAIIPPLALRGPSLTIRKFRRDMLTVSELVRGGSLSQGMSEFMEMCVTARKNIVISGGTGSGKTTTLNIVSNFIPEEDRVLTIEDAAELQLTHDHWVQLESRPANIEGKGAILIRDLVRNSLRMRPDRIIVGECRGAEALDMLQAMNTGHDGSLTTAHSNGPRDTLARLETMVLMAGMDLPVRAIREQIASALDMIIHQARFSDGSRRITHITEVAGMEGDVITLQDIFVFKQEGFDDDGRVRGRYVASGFVPRFYEDLQRRGIAVNMKIFRE